MAITLKNKNFAMSRLASAITNAATSLTVQTGQGSLFPVSGPFRAVIWSASYDSPIKDANREIVTLQLSSGDTFTATRGQEGTTARDWSANDYVAHVITAGKIDEIEAEVNAKADSSSVISAIAGKADKVSGATANRVAKLDSNGNLAQAGFLDSDVVVKTGSPSVGDGLVFNGSLWVPTPTPNQNLIINGGLRIWQRDYSPNTTISNALAVFTADRFRSVMAASGAGVKYSYDNSGAENCRALYLECTTAKTSLATADYWLWSHNVEGYDFNLIRGKTVTLSFWIKASKTGTYCVSFAVGDASIDRSYIAEFSVSQANTWEKKTITIPITTEGSPSTTNGRGMSIRWCLAAGSSFASTKDAWLSGNYLCSSSQANGLDTAGNKFWLSAIKLEIGNIATPFTMPPLAAELDACQRYFEKSYNLSVNPGTITDTGRVVATAAINNDYFHRDFKTKKRTSPTLGLYSPTTGNGGVYRNASAGSDQMPSSSISAESNFAFVSIASAGNILTYHWTADAEFT